MQGGHSTEENLGAWLWGRENKNGAPCELGRGGGREVAGNSLGQRRGM